MSFASRVFHLKQALKRSGRIETPMIVINDPEEGLEEFRLPEDVLNSGRTIEVGRPDPGGEAESTAEWVERLTREARERT
jgi:hypothetical protein